MKIRMRAVGAVLKLVNEERAKAGLPVLALHAGATRAAQQSRGDRNCSLIQTGRKQLYHTH